MKPFQTSRSSIHPIESDPKFWGRIQKRNANIHPVGSMVTGTVFWAVGVVGFDVWLEWWLFVETLGGGEEGKEKRGFFRLGVSYFFGKILIIIGTYLIYAIIDTRWN